MCKPPTIEDEHIEFWEEVKKSTTDLYPWYEEHQYERSAEDRQRAEEGEKHERS